MPFFAEQTRSALVAKQLGFAEYLNKMTFDSHDAISTINQVVSHGSYQKSISKIKALFVDRIMDQLDEGVFWTEKVIRYGTKPIVFRRVGMQLWWSQFLYLDTFALLSAVLLFIAHK